MIGAQANVGSASVTNSSAFGYRSLVEANNSIVLGSIAGVNGATANTMVGIGTTTPAYRLHISMDDPAAGGALQGMLIENTGGPSPGESAIAFKNIATGDSTWMIGLNESSHLSFAIGTQLVGGTTKMFIQNSGEVGIGTTAPTEKLDVNGNIKTNGKIIRPTTGTNNLVPICYGSIGSFGAINSGSGNFTVNKPSTGTYDITITSETYDERFYTALVTPVSPFPAFATSDGFSGKLRVRTFDRDGLLNDFGFSFVVYKQ